MDKNSTVYTLGFAAAITIVCAILLGYAATSLKPLQDKNADVDKKSKILLAVGEFDGNAKVGDEKFRSSEDVLSYFSEEGYEGKFIVKFAVNHGGEKIKDEDITKKELTELDLEKQIKAFPEGQEGKRRYPLYAFYGSKEAFDAKKPTNYIVPVYGYGLWSNCYGVVALDSTGQTVKNLVYYKHGETPGLGGEIEKAYFSKRFEGKKVYNAKGEVALAAVKGLTNENTVTTISGATFTIDGVNGMLDKFLTIYGVYIKNQQGGAE